ncbi:MAG TPA: HyaD/HybD family hydrogenase maturation endopeptidase [Thermomicrobiaceae bacterium]|nr:HyaD/HybD family hydrogenase maturation endopeptidase [Thermomicrobiaceae bacterium]
MTEHCGNIVVLGLGNLILSDEGLGVRAAHRLLADPRLPAGVEVIDGGTLGLELLSMAAGARRMLVLDAVDVEGEPGAFFRFDHDKLRDLARGSTAHQLGVADLLAALRMMGQEPDEVVLLGLQPESLHLGTELTPAVAASLDGLVDAAVSELRRWDPPSEERHRQCTKSG